MYKYVASKKAVLTLIQVLIFAFLFMRLASLAMYPLFDTTEARYAEIARIMFETQNWVTPQFDYNVPFWGKPPMHTWLTAMSFAWFGVSDFTARLPHFICGLLTAWMLYQFTLAHLNQTRALLATLILVSSMGFIISIGMVMTESALLLSVTLAMMSFWLCYQQQNNFYGYLFFASLGLGMLVKGPVAIVIVGIALVVWSVTQRCFVEAIKSLPWVIGIAVFLSVSLPWYAWAEARSPGFLEYFIVGEHWQRFLVPEWSGDLYGTAHDEPKGKIWLFWLVAAFPWSFIFLFQFVRQFYFRLNNVNHVIEKTIEPYLLSWMVAPLLLFTFSSNILSAYVLPGFSAMAILVASKVQITIKMALAAILSFLLIAIALFSYSQGLTSKNSESALLGVKQNLSTRCTIVLLAGATFFSTFLFQRTSATVTE